MNKKQIYIAIFVPIGVIMLIVFSLIGVWIWYLVTLPKLDEQLKYSPFYTASVWHCE